MVCVQTRYFLQSPSFVIQFLLNMTRGYVSVSTRCNTSTRRKLTKQFNKVDVIRLYSTPSVRLNLPTSLTTCLAWLTLIGKKKNRPDCALDRNTAQLSIGTAMLSGSEHSKTGRVFSYPFNATSEYSVIVHCHVQAGVTRLHLGCSSYTDPHVQPRSHQIILTHQKITIDKIYY